MKNIVLFLCFVALTFGWAIEANASPKEAEILADAQTGQIIYSDNAQSRRHPASLTKVMTLYLTFLSLEQGKLRINQNLPVSAYAAAQPSTNLRLQKGDRLSVRDAIYGLVTRSANDAAVVLAEAIGGSESNFARMMTHQARVLGMKNSVYRNPNGLPHPAQITTAFDQAILARAMLFHFPQYYSYFRTRAFTYDGVTHKNHNNLMARYQGMDGIKTGYIRASGYNLMASAARGNTRLIAIVFGGRTAKERDNRVADILDYGFRQSYAGGASSKKMAALPDTAISKTSTKKVAGKKSAKPSTQKTETAKSEFPVGYSRDVPTKTASAANGKWAVQVGAYASRKQGLTAIANAKRKAPKLLKNATAKIVPAKNGNKTLYRARLSGMDENTARLACDSLEDKGRSCLTVPPRG